ncbi:AbiJ-NTD4 domain-containing protein [Roseinatronobacter sp.]
MFSKKHGFATPPPIQFRHDAPEGMRHAVVQAAYEHFSYEQIRASVCRTLYLAPDKGNWSEIPNIRDEVEWIINDTEWYRVYDVIEALLSDIEGTYGYCAAREFADRINSIFVGTGAGWQLVAGDGIVIRGDADFEDAIQSSKASLSQAAFDVAAKEIQEALGDLSRRPEADLTGAIHHALGALEATARYISGTNDDLGKLASKIGLPAPLDGALKQMWGFSSNFGRHVSPTKIPSQEEAQLIVHLSSAYCKFLASIHR